MKTIITIICFLIVLSILFAQSVNRPIKIKNNEDALISEIAGNRHSKAAISYEDIQGPVVYTSDSYTITILEVSVNARTYYDFQSNGICRYIWQETANPNIMHSIFMTDPVGAVGFPDRKTKYFYSTNGGTNWLFVSNVPDTRSGFPYLALMNDGRACILNHTTDGGGEQRTQLYLDIVSGGGSFTRLDPGFRPPANSLQPIWPAGISTLSNKVVFLASENEIDDSTFRNIYNPPNIFSGYVPVNDAENISYSIARSGNKIGIVFVTHELSPCGWGCVRFIESTNDGSSWSSPSAVYNTNLYLDSLACLRSVDITYMGSVPKVIFGLAHIDEFGGYYPDLYSKMMLWSPNINGGNPVMIDSAAGLTGSLAPDVYVSVCRGVIGTSSDGTALYASWARARSEYNVAGVNYYDICFSYSIDGGATWVPRIQVTNNSGPLRDCRYPSISPANHIASSNYFAHLIYQQDSIPGSFVQGQDMSLARMMYARLNLGNIFVGIKNINSGVPTEYQLYQNYPNPFNPTTKMRFSIPLSRGVYAEDGRGVLTKLIVYDILGREVRTLVNEQLSPGTYEVDFDGTNYSSGVYFYTLKAGDYIDTKKLVLIK